MINTIIKYVLNILIGILLFHITVETIELICGMTTNLMSVEMNGINLLVTQEENRQILPVFLGIVISMEFIGTLREYNKSHTLQVQNIILISLMAVCRKLIAHDFAHADFQSNAGIAIIILVLALAYYFIKINTPLYGTNLSKSKSST